MSEKSQEASPEILEVYATLGLAKHAWPYQDRPDTSASQKPREPEFQVVLSQNAHPPPFRSR